MQFSESVISFYEQLNSQLSLPKGVELIYPFTDKEVWECFNSFVNSFYKGEQGRILLLGINPGRFGAGVTGIPFTDPYHLSEFCGIETPFEKRKELSSIYIYDLIMALGGPIEFYKRFYISSVCPLGFIKDGKNYNYYDDDKLYTGLKSFIISSIEKQLEFPCSRRVAYSLGKGKNYKILSKLNEEHKWFDEIIALGHPRWIMQYQRKNYSLHLENTAGILAKAKY